MENTIDTQTSTAIGPATAAPVSANEKAEERPKAEPAPEATVKPKGEAKYTDEDLDKILNKKFAKWKEQEKEAVKEAEKMAAMNAQEKAEYERDQLKKELSELKKAAALAEMSKTARKMLSDGGITISDDLLSVMVTDDAVKTKAAIDGFSKAFTEAVEAAVKERLKGEPPRKGSGGVAAMTKEQIMAIKDPELRQKFMAQHKDLFNWR